MTRTTVFQALALSGLCLLAAGCDDTGFGRGVSPATGSDERIATMQARLARNPADITALNAIGQEYMRQGQWDFAAGAFREALVVNAGNRESLMGYAAAQNALGQYDAALTHARRAGEARRDVEALMLEGIALNGLGRRNEARAAFDAAVAMAPRDLDARNNLALSLALAGDPRAYGTMRAVAFAPGADSRHRRNLFLVAAIAGQEATARRDGRALGVSDAEIEEIFAIGRRARTEGMGAFGLARTL